MVQRTLFTPRRPRTARLYLDIADDKGISQRYNVRPIQLLGAARGYRLLRADDALGGVTYHCALGHDGGLYCTCKGYRSHRHCKHLDSLSAAGLLDPTPYLDLRKLQLETQPVKPRQPNWPSSFCL